MLCTHTSAEQSDFEPSFLSFFFLKLWLREGVLTLLTVFVTSVEPTRLKSNKETFLILLKRCILHILV